MRYRRSRTLVFYWHDNELTAENYLQRQSPPPEPDAAVALAPLDVEVLDRFDDWSEAKHVAASFPDHSPESVFSTITELVDAGLLRGEHDGDERRSSRDAGAAPPLFKVYPRAPRVYLPRNLAPITASYDRVLFARRTIRRFEPRPVDDRVLSSLLHRTFGPMMVRDGGPLGTRLMKTSPSDGTRHRLEAYVAIFDVLGIDPGLYHYNGEAHALELLSDDFDRDTLEEVALGDPEWPNSAFACFVTALVPRTAEEDHHSRSYRAVLLNAGHIGQTFALTATALGLGPWQSARFHDEKLESLLEIDGFTETVVYMLGAGHPVPTPDGLPSDYCPSGPVDPATRLEEHWYD
ncbi:SagB/ThcOx family dehydrogenase [Nocardia sp. NPDC051570]|uniref:SagB/ThcOx family dehydrogenase n=1 Tax=Nocardia sp. NPDC051570 TaxID=3364324 RepID=UPI0037A67228